jgi:hypothetical protein
MRLGSITNFIRAFDALPCRVYLSSSTKRRNIMIMKVLLALMKDGRDQAFLMVIDYLIKENKIIRDKYTETGCRLILSNEQRRELAILAKPIIKHGFKHAIQIFTPDTLMKWYRIHVAREFDSSKVEGRKPGRPEIPPWVSKKILQMARANRSWGCGRIAGQISNLHFEVCEETVRKVLRKHKLEPAPGRDSQGTWSEFLKRHWDVMWATDFFTKTVLTMKGPVTFYVCFFIQLKTRRVVLGGITPNPNAEFMKQVARNLTGFELADARFIIRDGDTTYLPFDAIRKTRHRPRLPSPLQRQREKTVLTA